MRGVFRVGGKVRYHRLRAWGQTHIAEVTDQDEAVCRSERDPAWSERFRFGLCDAKLKERAPGRQAQAAPFVSRLTISTACPALEE